MTKAPLAASLALIFMGPSHADEARGLALELLRSDASFTTVLSNASSSRILIVGDARSVFPERGGGFHFEIRDIDGKLFPFCGMINQSIGNDYPLEPGETVSIHDDVFMLTGAYCLSTGHYKIRAKYFNYRSLPTRPEDGTTTSEWLDLEIR